MNKKEKLQEATISALQGKLTEDKNVDMSKYENQGFDDFQLEEIKNGLEKGLDVSIYADPRFESGQMWHILLGLEKGLDVSIYADPEFSQEKMIEIRTCLETLKKYPELKDKILKN